MKYDSWRHTLRWLIERLPDYNVTAWKLSVIGNVYNSGVSFLTARGTSVMMLFWKRGYSVRLD